MTSKPSGDKILVTGGTGFLGRHLGRALKRAGYEVVLCGRNNKQNLFASQFTGCSVLPMDVSRIESVRDIVAETNPDSIIHAAATKFVDLSEVYPLETIDINVLGSENVARVAIEKGVKLVIGVSTDKASPPIRNIYGLTKALMERLFCAMDGKSGTRFLCVRYGNVAWSTGSVLCIWRKMLREKGIIETTGAEMTRFFFTVEEAVALILTALDHASELHGTILAREMKSAKMMDILKVWTSLENARWIQVAGRPGDRQEEFLVGEQEFPCTRETAFSGIRHYIVSFNSTATPHVENVISSTTAEHLTEEEIKFLLTHPPEDEI